ncbi:rRNA maturation RNase YbeY [Pseudomonadota bacterium]
MSLELDIQYAVKEEDLPADGDFRNWAEAALEGRRASAEMTIRVVDEEESAGLNEQYRGKPGSTNVLSFPFQAPPQVESNLLGDLVICAPVVKRQAREQGKTEQAHWAHMVVHGTLHLLGYDHQQTEQAAEMEAIEAGVMEGLGFPDPYQMIGET